MYLSGRGGKDSVGDVSLPEIHMGEGSDEGTVSFTVRLQRINIVTVHGALHPAARHPTSKISA